MIDMAKTKLKSVRAVRGRFILGDGEVTGHAHTVRAEGVKMFARVEPEDTRGCAPFMLDIAKETLLRHEKGDLPAEHRDAALPPGNPCVGYKRQYEPGGWSQVQD